MTHDGKVQEIVDKKLGRIADNIEKELEEVLAMAEETEMTEQENTLASAITVAIRMVMVSIRKEIE